MSADQQPEIAVWFAAHDAYHKASDAYNARLKFVRAERERDANAWAMTCDSEYQELNHAHRVAMEADQTLYKALTKGASATNKGTDQ